MQYVKYGNNRLHGFRGDVVWKRWQTDDDGWTTDAYLYYKLTNEPSASTTGPCPTICQSSRTPHHWKLPSTITRLNHPHQDHLNKLSGPFEQIFVFPSHGDSIWNLASIGPVVSEEKMFKECRQQMDNGGLPILSSPMSLRLRWAKKSYLNEWKIFQRKKCTGHFTQQFSVTLKSMLQNHTLRHCKQRDVGSVWIKAKECMKT